MDSGKSLRIEKCVLLDESWQRQSDDLEGFVYFCVSWITYKIVQGVNDGEVGSCRLAHHIHSLIFLPVFLYFDSPNTFKTHKNISKEGS